MPNDIVLSVKDVLRGLRYVARAEAGFADQALDAIGGPFSAGGPHPAGGPVRGLADAVFGPLETLIRQQISPYPRPESASEHIPTIGEWFGKGTSATRAASFVHASYSLCKLLLRRLDAHNALISEQAINLAGRSVMASHGDLITRFVGADAGEEPSSDREPEAILLSAAIVCALVAAGPVRRLDLKPEKAASMPHLAASSNLYCCAVIGLATAVASIQAGPIAAEEIVDAACLAVEARFDRLRRALGASDPEQALARELSLIAPYLP